jgi:hypothetical protein
MKGLLITFLFVAALAGCQSAAKNKDGGVLSARTENTDTVYSATTQQLKSDQLPDSVFEMKHLKHIYVTGMDCDYIVRDKDGNDITGAGD